MRPVSAVSLAAAVCVMALANSACTTRPSADAQLQAIYADEWKWREEQFPDNEDAQKPIQDHLPKVDPASQATRLRMWQDVLQKLDGVKREELSAAEQINFDVYRPQIQALIADQQFHDFEMPANSDTTFWTDIGYTARRQYRSTQDYRNWIGQMKDIPRYFHEQREEMRAGLKRGFTPPRVTLEGRDASITAVTEATPEASLFYTPFKEMPGISDADKKDLRDQAINTIRDAVQPAYRAVDLLSQRIFSRHAHHSGRLRPAGRPRLLPVEDSAIHHARSGPGGHSCVRRIGSCPPPRANAGRHEGDGIYGRFSRVPGVPAQGSAIPGENARGTPDARGMDCQAV